ncbi:MAG: 3-deoxy-D-manno-octulosonic acid transferase [Candidatus Omnitrophica bacterium]|nr:3-deoxy-D-manno-octulosonic acid transferase [Candidatus Omnitrophota bacterium]
MFIVYDLIFLFISIFYLPVYLFRGKFHRGFLLRLGRLPRGLKLDRPIWVHAVSVGEAIMVRPLIEKLRQEFPGKHFVISTVTPTGNKIAKGLAREKDLVTYLPLDFSFIVRGVIDHIDPCLFVIAETELWPNLIWSLSRKKIPVVVVNGRISDASFRGYRAIKFLLGTFLNKVTKYLMQSARDETRLLALGVKKDKVQATGNMKFDNADCVGVKKDYAEFRGKLNLRPEERLLVAGSTHPGEEVVVLSAYKKLAENSGGLRLLIAPRHPQKAKEISRLVLKYGFHPVFISELNQSLTPHYLPLTTIFILDTVGQLMNYYAIADIVFMGGSLIKKGGHNILEPALFAKPILFGRYMFNFRDIADLFLQNHGAILVQRKEELPLKLKFLLDNPALMLQLGKAAQELVLNNQGAADRNLHIIKGLMSGHGS